MSATDHSVEGLASLSADCTADEVISSLIALFDEADEDDSGELDRAELAKMFKKMHARMGRSRNVRVVQREVDAAMSQFDADGSGTLSLEETVQLFCTPGAMILDLPSKTLSQVPGALRVHQTQQELSKQGGKHSLRILRSVSVQLSGNLVSARLRHWHLSARMATVAKEQQAQYRDVQAHAEVPQNPNSLS